MLTLGAQRSRIVACLGPSIGPQSYEVGPEFVDRFLSFDPSYAGFFSPSKTPRHAFFDLPALTAARLADARVEAGRPGTDTYSYAERFFSHLTTNPSRETEQGRQISDRGIAEGK